MRVGISKTLNILLFLFLMVGGIEITLRIFWANPYVLLFPDAYIHHPNLHRIFRHLDRVYEGAPDPVYFNTSSLGFIESRWTRELDRGNLYGAAFGGSTTESATVQEDSRWTDLLSFPVLNYGLSRMTSVNNYLAMKHVLQVQGMKPKIIFMMQGVNDVSAFLRHGVSFFDVDRYRPLIRNKGYDFIAKNVYSAAFLWRLWKQMDYHGFYARESRKSRSYPVMTEEEFQSLIERMETPLLAALQGVFNRMQILASSNEARLILITEPDSFRSDYHPWRGDDLRAYPLHRGKRCSVEQAGRLMDLYRKIYLQAATNLDLQFIDVAGCFQAVDVSPLIYDSVHLTERGSLFFANCVEKALQAKKIP